MMPMYFPWLFPALEAELNSEWVTWLIHQDIFNLGGLLV